MSRRLGFEGPWRDNRPAPHDDPPAWRRPQDDDRPQRHRDGDNHPGQRSKSKRRARRRGRQ